MFEKFLDLTLDFFEFFGAEPKHGSKGGVVPDSVGIVCPLSRMGGKELIGENTS
jgi:hypothetical protein